MFTLLQSKKTPVCVLFNLWISLILHFKKILLALARLSLKGSGIVVLFCTRLKWVIPKVFLSLQSPYPPAGPVSPPLPASAPVGSPYPYPPAYNGAYPGSPPPPPNFNELYDNPKAAQPPKAGFRLNPSHPPPPNDVFPDLPTVPTNSLEVSRTIGGGSAPGEDVDFDDLTRRFEALKKKK